LWLIFHDLNIILCQATDHFHYISTKYQGKKSSFQGTQGGQELLIDGKRSELKIQSPAQRGHVLVALFMPYIIRPDFYLA